MFIHDILCAVRNILHNCRMTYIIHCELFGMKYSLEDTYLRGSIK